MAKKGAKDEKDKKDKKYDNEIGGLLFVGSILIFGVLGMMLLNTGLGWILGVGIGFILMALARMKG